MNTFRNRQPEGIPTGGQFATMTKSEADVSLTAGVDALSIDPDCNTEAVQALADAGLKGGIEPYRGNDEDMPEGMVVYSSPAGHELGISGLGGEEVEIRVMTDDEYRSVRMTHSNTPSAEEVVKAVEVACWTEDVTDSFSVGFTDGENEIRETYFDRNVDTGDFVAGMTLSDQDGNWLTVDHNYTTGETTATPESAMGPGPLAPVDLDAVMSDMTGTDSSGNSQAVAAAAFGKIRNRLEGEPFYNKLAEAELPNP